MTRATAKAHPIQGLVKYHGLRDVERRIPFHASISVCTAPLTSTTTVEIIDAEADRAEIDGATVSGRALERLESVLDEVRRQADDARRCRVVSLNDFPQFVGLGSSSSGFAALAVAAAAAYGLDLDHQALSEIARLGAGSASRAVTGGVSEWVVDGERSYSRCILPADDLDWQIVVPLVRHEEPTENVHQEVLTSPLFAARVESIEGTLVAAREACAEKDLERLWQIAEKDTLNLHAVTMTGASSHLTWQPATVAVMRAVWKLREDGVPVYFSIDTGATAYLNTTASARDQVADAVRDIDGVAEVLHLSPGGATRRVEDSLF